MIIGGITAAGRTGGMRTGYSTRYLPGKTTIIPTIIGDIFSRNSVRAMQYSAMVRIMNTTGTSWVNLGDASYVQVNLRADAKNTAQITIQRPEIWSPYITGGSYIDLLRPSDRPLQIISGLIVDGISYQQIIYTGRITRYSEPQGANGGSINLQTEDFQITLGRLPAVSYSEEQTRYRHCLRQVNSANMAWLRPVMVLSVGDSMGEFAAYGTAYNAIVASVPGVPKIRQTGTAQFEIAEKIDEIADAAYSFEYSDRNITSITRDQDDYFAFNTIRTYGLVGADITYDEVSDAADVARRGKIYYLGFVGSSRMQLIDANASAAATIEQANRGTYAAELPYNPFLAPGIKILLSSEKTNIPACYAKLNNVRHQYSCGSARTYLDKFEVTPI
jgi:hypothetical protein